jgi:hypothetical protein
MMSRNQLRQKTPTLQRCAPVPRRARYTLVSCTSRLESHKEERGRAGTGSFSLPYRDISLIRNGADLGPYRRAMPRALWWS